MRSYTSSRRPSTSTWQERTTLPNWWMLSPRRPCLWGLAAAGEEGVTRVLEMLRQELMLAMALCGCPDVDAVDRSLIASD